MRDFLNGILQFIGSESLTDDEFATITIDVEDFTIESYNALKAVLESREGVSGQLKRLKAYFESKGVDIDARSSGPQSNILIGFQL